MASSGATPTMHLRRRRERQSQDPATLEGILREGLVAHVAVVREGSPVVLPFLFAPGDLGGGPVLLLHGSTGGGLFLDASGDGVPVSAAITLLDGLVYARSASDSSVDYRSAMVFGRARPVPPELRAEALRQVVDHLMPRRRAEVREMSAREIAATQVLQLPLDTVSVKVRSGGPAEALDDGEDHSVWAGTVPLALVPGDPVPSPLSTGVPPRSVVERGRNRSAYHRMPG